MQTVQFIDLGLMDYKQAWDYQESLFGEVVKTKVNNRNLPNNQQLTTNNYLLFCEHPHVYTLGSTGDKEHLLISEKQLAEASGFQTKPG